MKRKIVTAVLLSLCVLSLPGISQAAKKQGRRQPRKTPSYDISRDKVICFALYTVHNNILKHTAQLYPLISASRE